jgi:hypothetical protein
MMGTFLTFVASVDQGLNLDAMDSFCAHGQDPQCCEMQLLRLGSSDRLEQIARRLHFDLANRMYQRTG